jgi:hypothetical protein
MGFALRRVFVAGIVVVLLAGTLPGLAQDSGIVSTVNGESITRAEFQARVRLVRWQYLQELAKFYELTGGNLGLSPQYVDHLVTGLQDPASLGDAVLGQMEEERLLWQKGTELGLVPTAEDAQAQEAQFFSLWTDVAVSDLVQSSEAQAFISTWYANATAVSGLTQDELRALFANDVLRAKLYDYVSANVPTEELAVHTRHILCAFDPMPADGATPAPDVRVAAQGCIQAAQSRLQAGEAFESVAADLSDDSASAAQGGDVGFVRLAYLVQSYADAVRDAPLNTLIGPVETQFGFHLIEVLERESQALTDNELADARDGYFKTWIQSLRDQAAIQRSADWNVDIPAEPGLQTLDPTTFDAVSQFLSTQTGQ